METYNNPLQPMGPFPNTDDVNVNPDTGKETKKFEAAKDNAFREDLVTNNGGPLYRGGPIPGGAQGPTPQGGPFNKATGADGGAAFCGGSIDIGPNGRPRVTDFNCGVVGHTDWAPDKNNGGGGGIKNGEPGVATGPVATGSDKGGSVYTLGDAKKAGSSSSSSSSSSASDGRSGAGAAAPAPYKDPVPDSLYFYKLTTPPQPEINDLGPSTNDEARFGDDIAQRV